MNNENNTQSPIQITANQWAMAAHIAPLLGAFIPFGNIIAPYIIYSIIKPEETFAKEHAKASVNFQILVTILSIFIAVPLFVISFMATILDVPALSLVGVIGFSALTFVVLLGCVGFMLYNCNRASKQEAAHYPFKRQFLK